MSQVNITYHGHSMFKITSDTGQTIVTDPYDEKIKPVLPDVSADIVTVSHDHFDHSNTGLVKGNPEIIKTKDKRIFDGIEIEGIDSYHDPQKGSLRGKNIIFMIEIDSLMITHLGDLGHIPDDSSLKILTKTDVLMIPVGGIYTINAREAYNLTGMIEPGVVIPMHYKEPDSKLDVDTVDSFLSLYDNHFKKGQTVSVSKDALPDKTEVWVLESS